MTVVAANYKPGATLDPATYGEMVADIDYHIAMLRKVGVKDVADALEGARLSVDSAKAALELAIEDGEVKILCP